MVGDLRDLLEVRNALGHGHFTRWLGQVFPFTDRTARLWMNAAEQYGGKTEIISVLNDTVLLMLAAPSTPEEVRQEIEGRAAAGAPEAMPRDRRPEADWTLVCTPEGK